MIRCPDCGTDNRDGSRFCGNCGREFSEMSDVICPKCGTPNSAQNVLCSNCLSPLQPPSQGAPSQEPTSQEEDNAAPEELAETPVTRDDAALEEAASETGELLAAEDLASQLEGSAPALPAGRKTLLLVKWGNRCQRNPWR